MNKEILTKELRGLLREDILERYNNPEYWNEDLIREFEEEHKGFKFEY